MQILPNEANVTLEFTSIDDNFKVKFNDSEHEIIELASIFLHDVEIDEFGNIHGKYIKPESLRYYEEHVDKDNYPTYFDWSVFSTELEELFEDEPYKYKLISDEPLMQSGLLADKFKNKSTKIDAAFFIIRIHYNVPYGYVMVSSYEVL